MITHQKRRQCPQNLDATLKENQQIMKALFQWFRSQNISLDAAALAMMNMLSAYAVINNKKHPKAHINRIRKVMILFAKRMKHR